MIFAYGKFGYRGTKTQRRNLLATCKCIIPLMRTILTLYLLQKQEMDSLENAHKAEVQELQNKWNNIILPQNENEATLIEMELKKKQ